MKYKYKIKSAKSEKNSFINIRHKSVFKDFHLTRNTYKASRAVKRKHIYVF